jgi:hypothetical protein
MSELKPEERSWEPDEGEAAISELKQGIRRVKEHFEVFRAATAPDRSAEEPDAG